MHSKLWLAVVAILCVSVLAACGGAPVASPATATPPAPATATPPAPAALSIRLALPNAEYPIDVASTKKAQLKDGLFQEPAAPGSATMSKIQLGAPEAFGDLNADGAEDAAVLLVAQPGGSGTFTYLALVLNDRGSAKAVGSFLLGDRIVVKTLEIRSGNVIVTMLDRKPGEPMSAAPTVELTRTFRLQSGQVVEAK
ncbi:MAG: hypothetical protein HY259_13530 [Chloroflexi bacterium]|nr:hypothetical protein [Chloroflexota bacterium]MBI3734456.1 hypothetical protein [Chloroflexota bacterium]